ncbi:MAG: glycine cleavage system protein GcvH [Thermoprotei archaeon]|nr:MAG: glycine cleavage system protein GcvH [Thermoprotei archaeon]
MSSENIIRYKNYLIPKDRKYTKTHEWLKIVEDSKARVGITDYAQRKLKSIVYVEVPEIGKEYSKEEVITTVESVKAVGEVLAPVRCKVVKFNEELDENPGLINQDPYNRGWIVEVELKDEEEIKSLLEAERYVNEVLKKEE